MKNEINSKDLRVTPGEKDNLKRWPPRVNPMLMILLGARPAVGRSAR